MERRNHNLIAIAQLRGSDANPDLRGYVRLNQMQNGVLVTAEVFGLPFDRKDGFGIYAFHIHAGEDCGGNQADPFADADGHFNPRSTQHPYHAGDLPPLLGDFGRAYMKVLTGRFRVGEIVGRTVILHREPDDFHTQPSGNAGMKIACGVIRRA